MAKPPGQLGQLSYSVLHRDNWDNGPTLVDREHSSECPMNLLSDSGATLGDDLPLARFAAGLFPNGRVVSAESSGFATSTRNRSSHDHHRYGNLGRRAIGS